MVHERVLQSARFIESRDQPGPGSAGRGADEQAPGRRIDRPGGLRRQYPEYADSIRQLLPALEVLADLGRSADRRAVRGLSADLESADGAGVLGDFRILREVGRGGMGVVYEARQLSLGRRVALKVLPFAAALDPRQLQRFKVEAQAAALLHHTHIVPVFAVGVERGVHYYAMQLIDGRTLAHAIRELRRLHGLTSKEEPSAAGWHQAGPDEEHAPNRPDATESPTKEAPPTPTVANYAAEPSPHPAILSSGSSIRSRAFFQAAARLGIQAAEALEYAHSLGVVHRDVKPANLLLDTRGQLWVTDFGLAQVEAEGGLALTLTGDVLGTLRYMSPEQAMGRRTLVDHRTDIYSLGVTLYELLTLHPAIEGSDRQEILRRIAFDDPTNLRRHNPAVPRELETIVLKAMAKEPEGRYATAQELADDLTRFLENRPIRARRLTLAERVAKWARRHTAAVTATFAVLTIVVGALATSTLLIARAQRRTQAALETAEERTRQAHRAVDTMYTRVAEQWLAQKSDLEPLQRTFLLEALDFYRRLSREQESSPDPAIRREAARAFGRVADLEQRLGRLREAESAFRSALAILDALAADHPDPDYRSEAALIREKLGILLNMTGRTTEAEDALVGCRSALEGLVAERPAQADLRVALANVTDSLGRLWGAMGRAEEAAGAFRRAEAVFQSILDRDPADRRGQIGLANSLHGLGLNLFLGGRYPEARSVLERAIRHRRAALEARPGDEPTREALADDLGILGEVLDFMGQAALAEATLKEAETLHGELAREFPSVPDYTAKLAGDQTRLGSFYRENRRYRDAEEAYHRALAGFSGLRRRSLNRVEYRLSEAGAHVNLAAMLLEELGRPEDAGREAGTAVKLFEQLLKTSPALERARNGLATSLYLLGNALSDEEVEGGQGQPPGRERLAEARRCLERAIDLARASLETNPADRLAQSTLRNAHHGLADILTLSGRYDEAHRCCLDLAQLYETPGSRALNALERASDCLRILRRTSGLDPRRRDEIARAFIALGEDQRRRALAGDIRESAEVAELAVQLGFRLEPELRNPGAALRLARSLVEREPNSGDAWQALGEAHYGAAEWRPAREALEKANKIRPDDIDTQFVLAMSLWRCGDRDGAHRWYEQAVRGMDRRSRRIRAEAAVLLDDRASRRPGA